jgi:hypothetical protein
LFKLATRLLLIVLVFAGVYAGVSHAITASADNQGRELARWLLREARRTAALDQRAEEMAQIHQVKRAVSEEVIAGRLTLQEAAAQFRDADTIVETNHDGLIGSYRTPQTEEGLCRQVIAWVGGVLTEQGRSSERKAIVRRLEKELGERSSPAQLLN